MNLANRKIGPLVFAVACAISWSASADKVEIKGFPRFTQPDGISCGVTAGKIVLRAYNIKAGIGPLKPMAGTRWFSFQGS